jgi:death-associated protein kinase
VSGCPFKSRSVRLLHIDVHSHGTNYHLCTGLNGRGAQLAKIVLVGTHADLVGDCIKSDEGDYTCERIQSFVAFLKRRYEDDFDIHEKIFLLDARAAWTPSIKNLINCFNVYKERICQKLRPTTVFLDRCTYQLQQHWRKAYVSMPILPWSRFVESIRQEVNPLATDEHMKDLVQQLQLMGEVSINDRQLTRRADRGGEKIKCRQ